MCMMSSPSVPEVQQVAERSATRAPDRGQATSTAGRRTMDRFRSGQNTILTGGLDQTQTQTQGKTLLGA